MKKVAKSLKEFVDNIGLYLVNKFPYIEIMDRIRPLLLSKFLGYKKISTLCTIRAPIEIRVDKKI